MFSCIEANHQHIQSIDGFDQVADVIYPELQNQSLRPMLMHVHGGGFANGDEKAELELRRRISRELGFVTLSINYRLQSKGRFPKMIQDVANAVRWAKAHAQQWGGDPQRFILMGASAGACLTGHVVAAPDHPEISGTAKINNLDCRVQAWVCMWGPLDFVARWFDNGGKAGAEPNLLGVRYEENPTAYHQGSVLTHIKDTLPPALFVYGRKDQVVHQRQAELAMAAWKAQGQESELCLVDLIGHTEYCESDTLYAQQQIVSWLSRHFTP